MIRLLFVLLVTLGGFAAAALWNSRSDGVAEQIVSPTLRTKIAAEVDRLGLPKLAEKLPASKRARAAMPADSKPEPRPAHPKTPEHTTPALMASNSAKPKAAEARGGSRDSDESPHSGAGGSVARDDPDSERVTEVEVLVPRAEFARDFGPASDRGVDTASDGLAVDESATTVRPDWDDDSLSHDADRSARLIRRMLALYRSSGSSR
jgi:hypothetical protein